MLRDWVALNWIGQGDVVEIGAFAGGSTVAILQGMELARRPRPMHVFDVFKFPEGGHEAAYRKIVQTKGDSFRGAFDKITREWGDRLRVNEGDASQLGWHGAPIEILHIDCSISLAFHESIARQFYPYLVHGASLIHQDYGYTKAPFIKEMMTKLGAHVELWATADTTAYFVVKQQMTAADIDKALAA